MQSERTKQSSHSQFRLVFLWLMLLLTVHACDRGVSPAVWCAVPGVPRVETPPAPTWYGEVGAIARSRCVRCHEPGGLAPFPLHTRDLWWGAHEAIRTALVARTMPPFLASSCCTPYHSDYSLTDAQLATVVWWLDRGAPLGDPSQAGPELPRVGGVSRTDVLLSMPEAYRPNPPQGSSDDVRCFVLDWPLREATFVTGVEVIPGERSVVHHFVAGAVGASDVAELRRREALDPEPGFSCGDGLGSVRSVTVFGGSLAGGDFPDGLGTRVEPGSVVLLNVHYSTVRGVVPDRSMVRVRVDSSAQPMRSIVLTNPAWVLGDAMRVPAGASNVPFYVRMDPTLFTGGKRVRLRNVTPHMHYFGRRVAVRIERVNGREDCLLEIPEWHFGWEQPYWFAIPQLLEPGDRLYLECRFDNTAARQPIRGQTPRDFAWGGDNQDMCAAFLSFTEEP